MSCDRQTIEPTVRSDKVRPGLPWWSWLLVLAPALATGWVIACYSVNVLRYDQWQLAILFEKMQAGRLGVVDFWSQANESRIALPKLIFLVLGQFSGWDVRWEMAFSWLIMLLTAVGLGVLVQRTLRDRGVGLPTLAAAGMAVFNWSAYVNLLWGMQLVVVLVPACLVGCLVVAGDQVTKWWQWALCCLLLTAATWSYANGMTLWLVMGVYLWVYSDQSPGRRIGRLVFVGVMLLNLAVYFAGYHHPAGHPQLTDALGRPMALLCGVPVFLGGLFVGPFLRPWQPVYWLMPVIAGLIGVGGLLGLVLIWQSRVWMDRRAWPWLALVGYGMLSGVLVTAGRASLGVAGLMASRYAGFAAAFWIGLAGCMGCLLLVENDRWRRLPGWLVPVLICLGIGIAAVPAHRRMVELRTQALRGRAALMVSGYRTLPQALGYLHNQPHTLAPIHRRLTEAGYRQTERMDHRKWRLAMAEDRGAGFIETITRVDDAWIVRGWALMQRRSGSQCLVMLAEEQADGSLRWLGAGFAEQPRPDVGKALAMASVPDAGWQIRVPGLGEWRRLRGFAVDPVTGRVQRLKAAVSSDRP